MTLQDCVIAVIVYLTFREGTCNLYSTIFVDSLAGDIALIGILSGIYSVFLNHVINRYISVSYIGPPISYLYHLFI